MGILIIALVVIGIVFIASILLLIEGIKTKEWFFIILGSLSAITFSTMGIFMILSEKNVQPETTAIDVYRGLDKLEKITELEITSVNGVPTDTLVVVVLKK